MESLRAVPSWSSQVSSGDVSRRRVILWNRGMAPELAASVRILWRLAVAPGVLGVGEVVGSGMTGRVIARFNSARVLASGFFWNG